MDISVTKEYWKGITVLRADEGAWLTNGETYTDSVYLGKDAGESAWRDATAEEYTAWLAAQESAGETPVEEEPTPAWDITQGEYISEGFLLTRDGVEYECITGHYAAWNKQPPNEEYWRQV